MANILLSVILTITIFPFVFLNGKKLYKKYDNFPIQNNAINISTHVRTIRTKLALSLLGAL